MTPRQRIKVKSKRDSHAIAKMPILKLDEKRQPWERQPGESNAAYAAFQVYRDLDLAKRTYLEVFNSTGQSIQKIRMCGRRHSWVERAAAWDVYLDRAKLGATEKYQVEMAARHAEIAKIMLDRVRDRLNQINFKKLDPKIVAQWLDIGVKVERLARGLTPESTINTVNTLNLNLRQMSEEELEKEIEREGLRNGRDGTIDIKSIEIPPDTSTPTPTPIPIPVSLPDAGPS